MAEVAGDLAEIADSDQAWERPTQFVDATLDDPGIQVVRELAGGPHDSVGLDLPVEGRLPAVLGPADDPDLLPAALGELVDWHLGGEHLDPDRIDLGEGVLPRLGLW